MSGVELGARFIACGQLVNAWRQLAAAVMAVVAGAAVIGTLSADAARAQPQLVSLPNAGAGNFMRVYGQASAPYGWLQFCQANRNECHEWRNTESRVTFTSQRLTELDVVNRAVNKAIQPVTDKDNYGVTEYWTLPTTSGDCEDYALLKRKILIERGWPAGALLMTVVRDETGDGHAVLTVRTSRGDYVLDNKVSDIKLWSDTPYSYIMRQSYLNPNVWVTLAPSPGSEPAAIAGVRRTDR